jgi:hypothetical protein
MVFEAPSMASGTEVEVPLKVLFDGSFDVGKPLHRSVTDLYEASLQYIIQVGLL